MKRTPFAVYRQINLAVQWYGAQYTFYSKAVNAYGEPVEGQNSAVEVVAGIYHSSERAFIELVNGEGTSVKSKINKGILCSTIESPALKQGDFTTIKGSQFYVTAVEPVMYGDETVGYEISLEELVEESAE